MPQRLLTKTDRYSRRVLYGCTAALSVAIVGTVLLLGRGIIDQYGDKQVARFVRTSGEVQTEVDELSARLAQFADLYEGVWNLRQNDVVPMRRYVGKLASDRGVTVTGADLTATPVTLISSLGRPADGARLAMALRVLRDVSGAPLMDAQKTGVTLDGFLYAPDATFLAAFPAMGPADLQRAREQGPQAFIRERIAAVEQRIAASAPQTVRSRRPLWYPADEANGHASVSQLIVPMYREHERVLTIALTLPDQQFTRFFLRKESRRPGFFLLGKTGQRNLGDPPTDVDEKRLLDKILANASWSGRAGAEPTTFYKDGIFFVSRRIAGPDWIALYAYRWRDVASDLQREFFTGMLFCVLALGLLWAMAVYFDLRVTRPLLSDAKKLIEAEHFSKAIIDTLPIGIGVYSPESDSILLENCVAARMLGNVSDEQRRRFYRHVMHERDAEPVPGAQHSFIEVRWEISEGQSSYIGVASSWTRFGGSSAVLFGLVDMNERKANEILLVEAKQTADEANRAKSMFLAIVGHEIRTPLHGAIGHLELLARSSLSLEQREWVDMTSRSFDALLTLVNDLLDSTKIEANALQISPVPMCPNEVLERCARSFGAAIVQGGVAFHCITDPDLDLVVDGDDQRLTQILQNLLSNAAKFTERGTITISSRCLKREDGKVWARFEVADTGIGIPAAMQSTIFNPLAQADDSISRRFGGTGLGLFLCRNLAHLMGGRISVRSEPGIGSAFRVDLPFVQNTRAPAPPPPVLSGLSVELLCPVSLWREMLAERLRRWGATVRPADTSAAEPLHIRLAVEADGRAWNSADLSAVPLLGTVFVTAKGPLSAHRDGQKIEVSSFSREGLLAALTALTGAAARPAETPVSMAVDEGLGPNLDILVAEDDAVNRTLIKHQLAALGCQRVRVAVDGVEALEMWLERRADLVITDLGMPRLDGIGLLHKLRELDLRARVIATSASVSAEIKADVEQFSNLLQKPVSLSDLRRVLRHEMLSRTASPAPAATEPVRSDELDALLRQAFRTEWNKERTSIEQALAGKDMDVLRRRVHRLQGALMALGADELVEELRGLQDIYSRADWALISIRCQQLLAHVDASVG
ncbi:hybrid sensor histidine kinase/response regulator (plasmid) [Ralstonia solanacearum]|uniref:Virulence sensor protein BvgS n=1 Tax=Ralstonia solanacearum TaxID=305 RepID=A0AAD0SHK4_RALSL|nr:hybrid sensor histidine kinase/response regulator [Ralstonia solanacearum]AXW55748.1 hybrid sensor histidine kinase/response regulator [Ralstonia solanacearum]